MEDEVALAVKGKLPVSRAKAVLDQGIHWQEDDRVWNSNFQELFTVTLSFLRGMSEGILLLPPELQEDSELVHWIKVQLLLCERDFFPSNNLEKLAALRAIVKDSLNLYLDEMDDDDKATDLLELLELVDPKSKSKSDDEPSTPNPSDSRTATSYSEMEAILTEHEKRPEVLSPKRRVALLPKSHVPFLPKFNEDPDDTASPIKCSMASPFATRYVFARLEREA